MHYGCVVAVSVFFLLCWKAKGHLGKGEGEMISADCCSGKNQALVCQKDGESPTVLNWVAPGAVVVLAG